MKNKFIIWGLLFAVVTTQADSFNATNATWDDLLFQATRYGSTQEKRDNKEQARAVILERRADSLRFIMTQIQHENIGVQVLAQNLIQTLEAKEAAPVLLDFLSADDPMTRKMAAYFLGFYKTPQHAKKLLPLLDHEKTRGAAIRTLGKWKVKSETFTILKYLHDPKERIRVLAANALRDIGNSEGIPSLIGALDDPMFTVRNTAARALVTFGKNAEKDLIHELRKNNSVTRQRQIIRCLGEIKSRRALRVLRMKANSRNPFVRDDAQNAMRFIKNNTRSRLAIVCHFL